MRPFVERLARDEAGAVLVTVVAFLPVAIALAALVIDIGNGFVHRRHLQVQADAGVLAAGSEFSKCADADTATANASIESTARDYALSKNPQVGGGDAPTRVSGAVNATGYGAADDALGAPCTTGFVDLKLTDKDVPPFIALTGNQTLHAHARLQVFQLKNAKGLLPIAVEDPDPRAARAIFVDETTGSVLASAPLQRHGSQDGLAIWDNAASPVPVPIGASHVGVRVALGGASSTTCGDPLVDCYDKGSPNGIVHIQGWSSAGTVAQRTNDQDAPRVRSVSLTNGSCSDPYFSAVASTCTIGVRAQVDFGGDPANVGGGLTAVVGGANYAFPAANYDVATNTWTSGTVIPIQPGAGPVNVQLDWSETKGKVGTKDCTKGQGCSDTFGVVQRDFSASDDRSGPIRLAQVSEASTLWSNSLPLGSTHGLVVKVGVKASFGLKNATSVGDAPTQLRVIQGSQNQSLDCDPALSTLKDELVGGCAPSYAKNTGTSCPGSPSALWGTAQPWHCVAIQTGAATNQVPAGLNQRILGSDKPVSCTAPNNWSKFPNLPAGDPRLLNVIVTPFGSFAGNGSTTVPVTNMATFYITGWTGQGSGFANPCQGNGDDPAPDQGTIVGHFYKYVKTTSEGDASDQTCDFGSLGTCVAVLVE